VTLPERSLGSGAVCGGSCFAPSQVQQLLDLDVAGDEVDVFAGAGPEVDVKEALEADDVTEAMEVGRFPSKTNLELVPVDMGLIRTGDSVLRKSR
jgi:hypothetical protein